MDTNKTPPEGLALRKKPRLTAMERLAIETGLDAAGVGVTRTGATPKAGPGGSLRGYGHLLCPFTISSIIQIGRYTTFTESGYNPNGLMFVCLA